MTREKLPQDVLLNFRTYLKSEFGRRKKKNARYSLASFGQFLGTDASSLRKLMTGERPLGARTIRAFGAKLGLDAASTEAFVDAHRKRREAGISFQQDRLAEHSVVLGEVDAGLIARWETYAILELIKLEFFQLSADSVAASLGLTKSVAQDLIDRMIQCGWITSTPGVKASGLEATTTDATSPSIQSARRSLMESILSKSREAYATTPKSHALHYARTFTFDTTLMPDVMAKMRSFGNELEGLTAKKNAQPKDVYQVQIGFYPITQFHKK